MFNTAQGKLAVDASVVVSAGTIPLWVTQVEGYLAVIGVMLVVVIAVPRAVLAWRELLRAPKRSRRKGDRK
jgi:hypothetical protein